MVDYCISLFQKEQKEQAIFNYIATSIQFITENVAYVGKYYGSDGRYMPISLNDVLNPKEEVEMSAEEIVDDVLDKCGFLGG